MDEASETSSTGVGDESVGTPLPDDLAQAATGIAGLDTILGGGLPRRHTYLVHGEHGSGKTTLGLQFCLAGAELGERVLYVTTNESEEEIREVAYSHGWSLDAATIHCHNAWEYTGIELDQSVFCPTEIELPKTMESLLSVVDRINPQRLVIDSLSEIRLLAVDPRRFRRQVLALKDNLAQHPCTTLLINEHIDPYQPIHSIVHGVIELQQVAAEYGADRRRLRIVKLRAHTYASGFHDFRIRRGGIDVFPRLVAANHRSNSTAEVVSSGLPELDVLFGGGGIGGPPRC